jgi:hypothetical protein
MTIYFVLVVSFLYSCKKEKIYKGYYQFTMDIGYEFEGTYYDYDGPSNDTFNITLVSSTDNLLTFKHVTTILNDSYEDEEYLVVDKKENIAGNWEINGVGKYFLSGKITEFHESGKIEGKVTCNDSHLLQPYSLEQEVLIKASGPFKLEKID